MDESLQAPETPHSVDQRSVPAGSAQPCSLPKGRPKKIRPVTPSLAEELAVTLRHFFPELGAWLGEIPDSRDPDYAVFPLKLLLLQGVVMHLTHSGSRNHFNDQVRDSVEMAGTLARILDLEVTALPHLDTLEKVLRRLPSTALAEFPAQMVRRLIRMKALDDWRVDGRFCVAVDGTGLYSFPERHCEHCIETCHASGATTYSHKVLVAFVVSSDGYALPVACEFIENPGRVYDKQDCELKAFRRVVPTIKALFPQTPFTLLLDALYADQTVMKTAQGYGWDFLITFKATDMTALWREAQALLALAPAQVVHIRLPGTEGSRVIRWVNDLEYEGLSLTALLQEDRDTAGAVVRAFAHLTLTRIDANNAAIMATTARQRWRCENEGFNVLKNGGFGLEHVYSRDPVAAKCYVWLMLIAHTLQQLLVRGRLGAVFRDTFHTARVYGEKLMQALNLKPLPLTLPSAGYIPLRSG